MYFLHKRVLVVAAAAAAAAGALLCAHVPSVVLAADPPAAAAEEQQEAASPEEQQGGGVTGTEIAADEDKTALGIINKLKDYPLLGEKGANLLQLAEEGLGIKASQIELNKIVPMLVELQKNVHEHYMITKGSGKYRPSSLLKRVVGQKSKNRVIKSMKKFSPDSDDAELMQQLDIVTHLLHELHTNPKNSMEEIMETVSKTAGFNLEEEDMKELTGHMQWAQEFMQKIFNLLPNSIKTGKAEEL